jgi:hypothetical protein
MIATALTVLLVAWALTAVLSGTVTVGRTVTGNTRFNYQPHWMWWALLAYRRLAGTVKGGTPGLGLVPPPRPACTPVAANGTGYEG